MKYNELKLKASKKSNRVGRGISAGQGKTAGRGTKGQGARKSSNNRPGFEGGQMPIYMRLPHLRGFKSHRALIENVSVSDLELVKNSTVDTSALHDAGLISSPNVFVKLIGSGEIKSKKDVRLYRASVTAKEAIKKAGGSFTKTDRLPREKKSEKKSTK